MENGMEERTLVNRALYCIHCKSNSRTNPNYSFFRFPKDPKRCAIWKTLIKEDKIKDFTPEQCYNRFRLCCKHFENKMFVHETKTQLKKNAVPMETITITLDLNPPSIRQAIAKPQRLRVEPGHSAEGDSEHSAKIDYGNSAGANSGHSADADYGRSAEAHNGQSTVCDFGHSAQPDSGYSAEPVSGYSAEPDSGYSAEPVSGYSAEPVSGYSAEPESGYSAEPDSGYSAEPDSGYSAKSDIIVSRSNTDIPKKRRRSVPVYVGEFIEADLECPVKRRRYWEISQKAIMQYRKTNKYLRNIFSRKEAKIKKLNMTIKYLQEKIRSSSGSIDPNRMT
ncbi:uncharacterized protein LOC123319767 isoform X2 [Coccinella septempunctata]|uniref:uncharacterized protein LOC123319767 isoform X2 n=1 Tax=Coccinella septempunctata TaxID=41139 RepID=UPI001D0761A6|nr:uncharacterized protein LOC123319767 isoform X2 [Coccinella septempunctata]